ncbi:MAG: ABC transporter substrate-binding protein [Pseudonocardia sp.]
MRQRFGTAVAAAFALVGLAACGEPGTEAGVGAAPGFPMTVENCGRQVTFDAPPERVLAIGGEAGTLLWAAGGADRISTFAPLPAEPLGAAEADLAARPQLPISGKAEISREVMIAQRPDLVVTFGLNEVNPEDLDAAGIKSLLVSGYCGGVGAGQSTQAIAPFDGIYADIELYGRLLGTQDRASAAVADLRERVAAVQDQARDLAPGAATAALFLPGPGSSLGAYGNRSTVHQQMEFLGLSNVFAGDDQRYFEPNVETLISSGPEVVIVLYQERDLTEQAVRDDLLGRPEIAQIPAIANRNILLLDFFYTGHGTLAVDGLEQLAALRPQQR